MKTCPKCQQSGLPDNAKHCFSCGYNFSQISPGKPKILTIFAVLLAIVILIFIVVVNGPDAKSSPATTNTSVRPTLRSTSTTRPTTQKTTSTKTPQATKTHRPSPTKTIKPTPLSACPGADWMPQPSIQIGDNVRVCTKKDRLILRIQPKQSANEIIAVYPNSILEIEDGPYCADSSWWWKVNVPKDTKYANSSYDSYSDFGYLNQSKVGYVREGRDNIDKYFICP